MCYSKTWLTDCLDCQCVLIISLLCSQQCNHAGSLTIHNYYHDPLIGQSDILWPATYSCLAETSPMWAKAIHMKNNQAKSLAIWAILLHYMHHQMLVS